MASQSSSTAAAGLWGRANRSRKDRKLRRPVYLLVLFMLMAIPAFAQHERGELRLKVEDSKGGALAATVELVSEANQVHRKFLTRQNGNYVARELPFGVYRLQVSFKGFLPSQRLIAIRSEVPLKVIVTLGLAPVRSRINVTDSSTLLDPDRARSVYAVGPQAINEQLPAQMGRGLTDLVDSEPGWLYEANGVLHPRGSENGVQFVVEGLPLTENRSPAYAPPLESQDVESMRVLTAGFPAEYGRKLGGVVEVIERADMAPGLHLTAAGEGGGFATATSSVRMGYAHGSNQFTLAGEGGVTDRYLDPPVIANYTNHGSTGGFTATYSRDLTDHDRLRFSLRHAEVRYLVPNELVQQKAGQRQDSADVETSGQADYERVLSPNLLFRAEGSVRDGSFRLWSNRFSTPVVLSQQREFRQGFGRLTLAGHRGAQDWKAGADMILNPVHEALRYAITDPSQFDPGTALQFGFQGQRSAVEPAAFAQDEIHRHHWNLSLGLRYDHYGFVVRESAWSPRVAASRYFPLLGIVVHAAYDRVFQTPAVENLLLASSPQVQQISGLVLRLPVKPARANYYEAGFAKGIWGKLRLDANVFRRNFRNYPDDDTLLNTGVSFPIADSSAWIEGVEAKLALPRWGRFSGYVSYANQEGVGYGPITGGLLIGAQAVGGVADSSHFWISQDQRNTGRALLRFQADKRLWLATSGSYGSGLPVELDAGDTDYNFLLQQYGPRILNEVDFARGRVRPSYSIGAAAGLDLYAKNDTLVSVQIHGSNLTNHLNVINFASLFSGTAVGTPRSFGVQLKVSF